MRKRMCERVKKFLLVRFLKFVGWCLGTPVQVCEHCGGHGRKTECTQCGGLGVRGVAQETDRIPCDGCALTSVMFSKLTLYPYDHMLLCPACIDIVDPKQELEGGSKTGEYADRGGSAK